MSYLVHNGQYLINNGVYLWEESPLLSGLISYWKLDEISGNVIDYKNGNNGTSNAVANSFGKINSGYFFNGDTSINCGNPSNLQLVTDGTVSLWYLPSIGFDGNYHVLISKANANLDRNGYTIYTRNSSPAAVFEICSSTGSQSISRLNTLVANEWIHLTLAWDPSYLYSYVNASINKVVRTEIPRSSVYPFKIGHDNIPAGTGLVKGASGNIDEVCVWNRALTQKEVSTLYNNGYGLSYPFSTPPLPNMIYNGTFNSSTGWIVQTDWTIADGVATYGSNIYGTSIIQTQANMVIGIEPSTNYTLTFDLTRISGDLSHIRMGLANADGNVEYPNFESGYWHFGHVVWTFTTPASVGVGGFQVYAMTYASFSIDNIFLTKNYKPQYQTVYDSFTTKPDVSIANAQNTLVKTLVDSGTWSKLDLFYCFAQNASDNALINWINPGVFNAINASSWAFTQYSGFIGANDATNILTGWDPSNNRNNYQLTACSIGAYLASSSTNNGSFPAMCQKIGSTAYSSIIPAWNNTYVRLNTTSPFSAGTTTDARGLFIGVRKDSSISSYKNNQRLGIGTTTTSSIVGFSQDYEIGGYGTFYNLHTNSVAFIGGTLTDLDVSTLYSAIQTYMTVNGKQV